MGEVEVNGVRLFYREAGSGPQTVVLSHSFLVDHRQFEAQIEALGSGYHVIAYDHRDHGRSARVGAPYDLAALVSDAEALFDALSVSPCHFVGLSTGGFVGMRLALRAPEQFRSLTLMDTSAEPEALRQRIRYRALLAVLGIAGVRPVLRSGMTAMFSRSFLRDPARQDEVAVWRQRIADNDPRALIRFSNAIFARDDVVERLRQLEVPTLVVVGEHDRPFPPERARTIAAAIPGAKLAVIPGAGHLSTIEQPEAVNDVLVPFIGDHQRAA
jgi:pimeloyl-ACP methyl ester carboxylesterase